METSRFFSAVGSIYQAPGAVHLDCPAFPSLHCSGHHEVAARFVPAGRAGESALFDPAALWGSQSWLQPAFSRLLLLAIRQFSPPETLPKGPSPARVSALRSRAKTGRDESRRSCRPLLQRTDALSADGDV